MKHIILASTSVLAMVGSPAAAQAAASRSQSAPVPQSTPAANAPQGGAPSSVAPEAEEGIQDIIVTAQRTEQSAQKAPLPISVVKPEELIRQNIVRSEDLSRAVPALVAASNGGAFTSFFLRGVGNFTTSSYSDAAIAFNYDGVYIGRSSNTQGLFYDLQRIEVLKGPQGTLYGRNATGGAINVFLIGRFWAKPAASFRQAMAITTPSRHRARSTCRSAAFQEPRAGTTAICPTAPPTSASGPCARRLSPTSRPTSPPASPSIMRMTAAPAPARSRMA